MDPIRPGESSALDSLRKLSKLAAKPRGQREASTEPLDGTERAALRALVAAVDPSDPAAVAAIQLPLLRHILSRQFAPDDPQFGEMLASVNQTVSTDARMQDALREALQALKR